MLLFDLIRTWIFISLKESGHDMFWSSKQCIMLVTPVLYRSIRNLHPKDPLFRLVRDHNICHCAMLRP